ncbi:MAG: TMEM175 family protein [Eubacteriales bacterium]|nr:TMEM175 family protein [Eubacteriales bacterium]
MKQRIKSMLVRRYLREEDSIKYEHLLEKRAEGEVRLRKSMISHLSTLNDGIVAIFITVMMLEIPFPTSERTYWEFVWSVLVFFVSFFIVADFWYDNKRIFEAVREADHLVIVANFMFLASLALIPVATKWIMHQKDRYSAVHFGAIYMVTSAFQQFLYYTALRKRFRKNLRLFLLMIVFRACLIIGISAVLMLISWFYPEQAVILYIILPVVNFFLPQ